MNTVKKQQKARITLPVLVILLSIFVLPANAENLKQVVNLEGTWKFTIGDDPAWASGNFNDKDWDYVYVPRSWESNGFNDYNGYAWYRKVFKVDDLPENENYFLLLGNIDDVDEVYLNGKLIGTTGVFPPLVQTAYQVQRKYPLPLELLKENGENTLAVRVYDEYLAGGIYTGPVGIYVDRDNELLSLNLAGYWNFETVNKVENRADEIFNQEEGKIYVPGFWESRGYPTYDGSAIYSTSFRIPQRFNETDLMLVVGYIDDVDKVYINDKKIGTVSDLDNRDSRDIPDYLRLRGYKIPEGTLNPGGLNTITVKVYDTQIMGGIYEGPVGLITTQNFKLLKEKQVEKPYNMWDSFFKSIFD